MATVTYELWRAGTLVSTGLYSEDSPPREGEEVEIFHLQAKVRSVIVGLDGSYRIVVEAIDEHRF